MRTQRDREWNKELLMDNADIDMNLDAYGGLKDYEVAYLKYRRSRIRNNQSILNDLSQPDLGDDFS